MHSKVKKYGKMKIINKNRKKVINKMKILIIKEK